MLAFLTVLFRVSSLLVVGLVAQSGNLHKMRAVWILMFVATAIYSSEDSDFVEAEVKKGTTEP